MARSRKLPSALPVSPWLKQGQFVNGALTTAAAIKAAKLDWEVTLEPAGYQRAHKFMSVTGDRYIIRVGADGNDVVLGNATTSYHPLQNTNAFAFIDDVVDDPSIAVINSAGYINDGKQVWVQLQIPALTFDAVPGDTIQDHLTIFNSHAADRSVVIIDTPIRVISQSTANRSVRKSMSIRHTSGMLSRMRKGADIIAAEIKFFNEWRLEVKGMVAHKVTQQDAIQFALDIIQSDRTSQGGKAATTIDELQTKQRAIAERLMELIESGQGTEIKGVRGTGWGLYSAVLEYVDHYSLEATGRPSTRSIEDRRLQFMLFGNGALMKDRALAWLLNRMEA